MIDDSSPVKPRKRTVKPLNSARLEELALGYVARFSTTAVKLERYLQRKLRERGWEGEGEPPVASIVENCVRHGYIDDEAFAHAKAGGLLRRGYGAGRVSQALGEAGVAEGLRESVRPSERAAREAIFALARRRRFGPFAAGPIDKALREKQIAAMLRAGHPLDSAREIVDAASIADAERWVVEATEDMEQ